MEWTHIDLLAGSWTKPTTKNRRPHRIPVPRQTCAAIEACPRTGRYVLMGLYGHHLSRSAAEKMWGILRRVTFNEGDPWPALRMPDVRLHDFRRTVASRLLDQGESELLIKSVLNHCKGNVTAVYARASFDTQAIALQRHADGLWALLQEVSHDTQALLPLLFPVSLCATPSA
jgi:integrase